jgi:hypothetical protein
MNEVNGFKREDDEDGIEKSGGTECLYTHICFDILKF